MNFEFVHIDIQAEVIKRACLYSHQRWIMVAADFLLLLIFTPEWNVRKNFGLVV